MTRWLAGLVGAFLFAAPAAAAPPVWVVTDADSEMVLFGSVHLLPPDLDWSPPALDAALKTADDVWFESPVGDAADREASDLALKLGVLPQGETLSARLPRRDAELLRRTADHYGISMELLDSLKPWLAETLVAQVALGRENGAYADYSVEAGVDRTAPARVRREVFASNTEHLAILDGAPEADQIASLRETLRALKSDPKSYGKLIAAWMKGDLKWMQRNVLDVERKAAPAQFRRLMTDRNACWTARLNERLKGRGRTVVVVGMAHMIGSDGLPARLRALGYSVKGP